MSTIEIPVPDGTAEAFVARPSAGSDHPGVLFFIDAIGLRPQIEQMVQRIADWGYVVMAPNLFYRLGRAADLAPTADLREPGAREAFFANLGPRVQGMSDEQIESDVVAYVDALRTLPGVAAGPLGVTGYCMGSRFAVKAAGLRPDDVRAVGAFHGGRLVTEDPGSPHLSIAHARAEFLMRHADNDASMDADAIATLGRTFAEAGVTASNEVYDGAPHGYSMADTSMYDESAAERHFEELRELYARTLG
ncbi:MAG: dienelactone hydrolase family protein [Marmoricola sp.]